MWCPVPPADVSSDVRVVDIDAPSYHSCSLQNVSCSAEGDKKHKNLEACLAHHDRFACLCFSTDGMLGSEADFFLHRLAEH